MAGLLFKTSVFVIMITLSSIQENMLVELCEVLDKFNYPVYLIEYI